MRVLSRVSVKRLFASLLITAGAMIFSVAAVDVGPARAATYLGGLDLQPYCKARGYYEVFLIGGRETGYNWACRRTDGSFDRVDFADACHFQYGPNTIDKTRNFWDAHRWGCFATGGFLSRLGSETFNSYCQAYYGLPAQLVGQTAYDWKCQVRTPFGVLPAEIDMANLCYWRHGGSPIDRFTNFWTPYSWECWA